MRRGVNGYEGKKQMFFMQNKHRYLFDPSMWFRSRNSPGDRTEALTVPPVHQRHVLASDPAFAARTGQRCSVHWTEL